MPPLWRFRGLRWIIAACLVAASSTARAGTVQQITSFGANPSGIGMYLFTPTNVASKPAVLVGVHACHGKGTDVCTNGGAFAQQADKFGFLLICPSAVSTDGCWDVHSTAGLTHDGGSDAAGIMSMVAYVVQNKNGDPNRIYVAGHSSGGMMTNVLIGAYPDVFKAGAAYAGVAFGCYATGPVDSLGWNSTCANGNVTKTAAQWGDQVRAAYPGFAGTRPRMQLWHGTVDAIVNFRNFGEEIKQWTNVLGAGATPASTENNALQSTWIRTRYTDSTGTVQVEAIQETGQPHNLVVNAAEAIRFFGLDGAAPPPPLDGGAARDSGTDSGIADGPEADRGAARDGSGSTGGSSGAAGTMGGGGAGTTGTGGGATGGIGTMPPSGTGGVGQTGGATAPTGGGTGVAGTGGTSPAVDAGVRGDGASNADSSAGCAGCSSAGGASRPGGGLALLMGAGGMVIATARRRRRRAHR